MHDKSWIYFSGCDAAFHCPKNSYTFENIFIHVTVHLLVLHLAFAQHEKAETIKQDKLYKKIMIICKYEYFSVP